MRLPWTRQAKKFNFSVTWYNFTEVKTMRKIIAVIAGLLVLGGAIFLYATSNTKNDVPPVGEVQKTPAWELPTPVVRFWYIADQPG